MRPTLTVVLLTTVALTQTQKRTQSPPAAPGVDTVFATRTVRHARLRGRRRRQRPAGPGTRLWNGGSRARHAGAEGRGNGLSVQLDRVWDRASGASHDAEVWHAF